MPRVEEIVERVWPGREARIEALGGGITNRNFKVASTAGDYVLRIGGKDTALLGIDRRAEHGRRWRRPRVGVGPEVIAYIEPEGYLVTRYIEGETRPGGDPRAGAAAAVARAARDPRGAAAPGAVRRLPRRGGLRGDGGAHGDRGAGRVRAGARAAGRDRARRGPVPSVRATTTC